MQGMKIVCLIVHIMVGAAMIAYTERMQESRVCKVWVKGQGSGSSMIRIDEVNCAGHEDILFDCPHNGWGNHDFIHREDAGVSCLQGMGQGSKVRGQGSRIK